VGYLGCKEHLKHGETGVFIETAHPGKFKDSVEQAINEDIELPDCLQKVQKEEKKATKISSDYKEFKEWLLSQQT
jgi:threonine synthase